MAERETTPDGRPGIRVTWRLRDGWRWGDGRPVSTEDLLFTWQAGRDFSTGFGGSEFYRSAYEAIVVDPRTITLRFDRVTFDYASAGNWEPLPAHVERSRWEQEPRSYRSRDFCWWLGVLGKWDADTPPQGAEHVTIAVFGIQGGYDDLCASFPCGFNGDFGRFNFHCGHSSSTPVRRRPGAASRANLRTPLVAQRTQ